VTPATATCLTVIFGPLFAFGLVVLTRTLLAAHAYVAPAVLLALLVFIAVVTS
jgi:hypothetical protein